ncbi:MAG: hypothetical protein AAGC53_22785, partial [Actinomycetota bacterium]
MATSDQPALSQGQPARAAESTGIADHSSTIIAGATLAGGSATWLGYGTDIDVANVLRAGESFFDGDYQLSRPPGNLPYEIVAYLLDAGFGSVGVVIGSLLTGAVV